MKKLIVVGMFLLSLCQVQGQNQPKEINNELYKTTDVEIKPEFPGGMQMFYKYIGANFKLPRDKDFKGGRMFASFTVGTDGKITDIKVKDLGFGTKEELIRVLENSPLWIPAELNGQKVRCSYVLPVSLGSNN